MSRRAPHWFGVLCALLAGCAADGKLTEIMVVVRSRIGTLDSVDIEVDGMGAPKLAHADLKGHALPRTLAVVYEGGKLGPITITARGLEGKSVQVHRTAKLSFVLGRNVALVLDLTKDCLGMDCTGAKNQTCVAGACSTEAIDSSGLQDWPGSVAKLETATPPDQDAAIDGGGDAALIPAADGGSDGGSDGGMDAAATEAGRGCPAGYGQCAGDTACTTRLDTLQSCGGCGTPCVFDKGVSHGHGTLSCASERCEVTCASGYLDLDGEPGNGCEGTAFPYAPSNVDLLADAIKKARKSDLTIDCDVQIDTSGLIPASIEVCGTTVTPVLVAQPQVSAPELVVLPLASLHLTQGHTLRLLGTRPVLLLVYGAAQIDGVIDASADATMPGAGGNVSCTTGVGGKGDDDNQIGGAGGGGGGFGTTAANGGRITGGPSSSAGAAGLPDGNASLVPLRGGCAGGFGGAGSGSGSGGGQGGAPGAGGGAVQLSVAGELSVTGVLAAAGGGGQPSAFSLGGAGGGGSGGALLLQAAKISLLANAWLTSNGGGGGGGNGSGSSSRGAAGDNGATASAVAAAGGGGNSGDGGNGGSVSAATAGKSGGVVLAAGAGGGGGGAAGRIRLVSPASCPLDGMTSPAAATACP